MKKYVIAGLLVAGFVTPAFAADFYVAQNATSHKCSVMSKKPDGKTMMMIGKVSYKSQADAEAAMKAAKECKA